MKVDIQKLDERIKKLQEIRRIATDPELASILQEFLSTEDAVPVSALAPKLDEVSKPRVDDTHDLMKEVLKEIDAEATAARDGLWSKRR